MAEVDRIIGALEATAKSHETSLKELREFRNESATNDRRLDDRMTRVEVQIADFATITRASSDALTTRMTGLEEANAARAEAGLDPIDPSGRITRKQAGVAAGVGGASILAIPWIGDVAKDLVAWLRS